MGPFKIFILFGLFAVNGEGALRFSGACDSTELGPGGSSIQVQLLLSGSEQFEMAREQKSVNVSFVGDSWVGSGVHVADESEEHRFIVTSGVRRSHAGCLFCFVCLRWDKDSRDVRL